MKGPAFHLFTAFSLLCYGIKAIYFLGIEDPAFALGRYPSLSELPGYAITAVLISFSYWVVTALAYSWFRKRLPDIQRPSFLDPEILRKTIVLVGTVAALAYLAEFGLAAMERFVEGRVFGREWSTSMADDFESGQLGLRSLFAQVRIGLFYFLAVLAVKERRHVLTLLVLICFLTLAALSSGSRFTLLGAVVAVPLCWWITRSEGVHDNKAFRRGIYVVVMMIPVVAAPLLHMRRGYTLSGYSTDNALADALVTFDPLDHLVNYLTVLPFDGGSTRALQELWQFIPRAWFPEKPFLYGMLALQDRVYPGSIGAGTGTFLYGHYPMSNVAMALDLGYGVGLIFHPILAGLLLALMDHSLLKKQLLALPFFVQGFLTLFHLLRAGAANYTFSLVSTFVIPLFLVIFITSVASFFLRSRNRVTDANDTRFIRHLS